MAVIAMAKSKYCEIRHQFPIDYYRLPTSPLVLVAKPGQSKGLFLATELPCTLTMVMAKDGDEDDGNGGGSEEDGSDNGEDVGDESGEDGSEEDGGALLTRAPLHFLRLQ